MNPVKNSEQGDGLISVSQFSTLMDYQEDLEEIKETITKLESSWYYNFIPGKEELPDEADLAELQTLTDQITIGKIVAAE